MVNYIEHYSKIINPSNFLSEYAVLISILLFFAGQIIISVRRRINKVHELKQRKQFVKEWVKESIDTLDKYINSLEDLSGSIAERAELNSVGWKYNIIHFSRINDISLKEYFETFNYYLRGGTHNQNSKKLSNFLFKLDHIDKIHPIIINLYKEYFQNNNEILNEWNLNYMKLANLFTYINYNDKKISEVKSIIKEASDMFSGCPSGKKVDLNIWLNNYINPILQKLDNDDYKQYTIINEIHLLTSNLNIVTIKHDNIKNFSTKFKDYADDLKASEEIIRDSINYFDDKKFQSPYNLFNNL